MSQHPILQPLMQSLVHIDGVLGLSDSSFASWSQTISARGDVSQIVRGLIRAALAFKGEPRFKRVAVDFMALAVALSGATGIRRTLTEDGVDSEEAQRLLKRAESRATSVVPMGLAPPSGGISLRKRKG
ncbi:MAG: hypothetical protein AAFQ82_01690 [Myxococcota bacterium]